MSPTRYTLQLMKALLALMWGGTATAATVALTNPALEVDPVLMLLSAIISTLAGATTLAIRVNNLLLAEDGKAEPRPLVRPWLFAIAHMLGSWLTGVAFFLYSRSQSMDVWMTLLVVLVFSFVGAKAIEMLAERILPVRAVGGQV